MRLALPVARRLLLTLRGDRRTLGLVVGAPAFIIFLFSEVFPSPGPAQRFAPVLLGVFVFVLTYLLTAIGFLRERQTGTLERIRVSPVRRTELVVGYVLGFGVLATIQSLVLLGSGVFFLDAQFEHGIEFFFLVEILGALSGLGIGIVLSLFAENEFQVLQFMPVVISPQLILGGTFLPVEDLAWYLEYPARAMPVTYLIKAMDYVVLDKGVPGDLWVSLAALGAMTVLSIVAAALVVNRT